jgi:Tol biopolymer transport system component
VFASDRSGNADIWVINADGTNPMKLTSHSAGDTSPAWSPDGTRIAFSSDRGGDQDIYVMDCDGGNVKRLAAFPGWDALPAWSPDGKKIAWARGIFSIWVMDGDGGNQRQLVSGMGDVYNPLWSPDGEYIYFNSDVLSYDLFEIWRVRANGTEAPEQVTSDGNNHWRFCLSPVDRAKVVLDLDIGGRSSYVYTVNPEIYVMNADGSDMLNISNHPARDYYPSWSPDGTKGVFYSDRTGNWDIWVVPIAVPSSVAMAPCPDGSASLMWRPFGTKSYTVLYRDNLHRGDWSPVEGMVWPITARFWKDKAVPGVRQRFYRVESH